MKTHSTVALLATVLLGQAALSADTQDQTLKSDKDRVSYAVGVDIGRGFHTVGADLEVDPMMRGLRDGMSGAQPALSDGEMRQLIATFRTELGQRQQEATRRARVENQEKGEKFQADYKKRDGVTALPDGLMYRVVKQGNGRKPGETDTVLVNYQGRLVDGTEFDANQPGKPASFKVNGVIKGWREALQQMPAGSKWEIVIPPAMAYGERGAGHSIPPASTLIFEVELLSIAEATAPAVPTK
jgi:FKBP-type peptidyl-prolyl cis-trans isomerase FklB